MGLSDKYRPSKISEVVGQEGAAELLKNVLSSVKPYRTHLYWGPYGCGKTTMARIAARSLTCQSPVDGEPCGKCKSCKLWEEGKHPDVKEVNASESRGIDIIRGLIEQSKLMPMVGRHRIIILDEVHMLTQQAFQALLKPLEEPPGKTIWILLTTEPAKIPATIQSRSLKIQVKTVPEEILIDYVKEIASKEGKEIPDEIAKSIAMQSNGHVRDAMVMLEGWINSGHVGEGIPIVEQMNLSGNAAPAILLSLYAGKATTALQVIKAIDSGYKGLWTQIIRLHRETIFYLTSKKLHDPYRKDWYIRIDKVWPDIWSDSKKRRDIISKIGKVFDIFLEVNRDLMDWDTDGDYIINGVLKASLIMKEGN